MPRSFNKINLPTNTTDIQMFAKYLKAIDEKGIVTKEEEQALFAEVKISGSRKDVKSPKRDTHTKQTLNTFGLIEILDDGSFQLTNLGKEVLSYFNSPDSHSKEESTALMLKVFMRWSVDDNANNRHMHPGYLILKLLCDPDLDGYFTNQEFADFVMNPDFISDEQYNEIKDCLLEFRRGVGISKHVAQSKAGTFLASLVNNWKILTSSDLQLNTAQLKQSDKFFKEYQSQEHSDDAADPEEVEEYESAFTPDDINGLSDSERNAFSAFHSIKKYTLTGIASYIAHLFIYLNEGMEVKDYNLYFSSSPKQKNDDNVIQKIYFGAPGTGKSYTIKNEIIPSGIEPYRVTFYPDYYYSDFVGGLRPKNDNDRIRYEFEPGPFAEALRDSFFGKTFLIIEEINRGNAAAIFGDIFQLLDRKGGQSEYSITNKELYDYLVKEKVTGLEKNKVYLPSNLNILCTMNTADQNVFVLDTAFKRRFKMEYVPIDFNAYFVKNKPENGIKATCIGYINNTEVFNGNSYEGDLKVVMTPDIYNEVAKTITIPQRDWRTFASFVNARIDAINKVEQKISEDKKLGPFFVDADELKDRKAFADKVLYYLKQDVFKYEDSILEDSYEVLYDRFVNKNEDIFMMI